jgi:allantoicase
VTCSENLLRIIVKLIFASREAYRGGIHDDSGPAMDAWETLREESPDYFFCTITFVLMLLLAQVYPQ